MTLPSLPEAWGALSASQWGDPEALTWGWALLGLLTLGLSRFWFGGRWSLPLAADETRVQGWLGTLAWLPLTLRLLGLVLLLLALARPQSARNSASRSLQSRDIMLALDVSGSMQANDLQPTRLEAAKKVLKDFVGKMEGDRLGLVVFAGKAFTQCPLSMDRDVVRYFIDQVQLGTVNVDGTAVGDGLLLAIARLAQEPKNGQVVVLATDGRSNTGQDALQAAQLAAASGIRVYTIGIGRKGGAIMKQRDAFGRMVEYKMEEPDESTLGAIAQATGGRYFRATDQDALARVYATIERLERREVKVKRRQDMDEHFWPFLLWGALLLGAEALLRLRLRVAV